MTSQSPTLPVLKRLADRIRTPRLRSMREFAESEIILPTGPFAGRRFRVDRNPYAGLLLDAFDSRQWRRFATLGPRQTGKTLLGFVVPIMYHLFEVCETVICGVPSLDMVADKWSEDLLPAIAASRYREFLPRKGSGSRGGSVSRIQFNHGPTLRFMSGGGGDKARVGFTSRVLAITETDGMDQSGGTSREADKISQLEGCLRAFGDRAVTYMECTVSIEKGRTWQEYSNGTQSQIATRCPHCREFVTPEREHLIGWQGAEDLVGAAAAHLVCPGCGAPWSEDDRQLANRESRLLHRGQKITVAGGIEGAAPATDTLGFRWTATNNLLVNMAVVGQDEWRAARDPDEENADKKMRQFVWTLPHKRLSTDLTAVDTDQIVKRATESPRGHVPIGVHRLTLGIDLGKWLCHWTLVGWSEHATPHVIEYGRLEVPSNEFGEEHALLTALREFRDSACDTGWPAAAGPMMPTLKFIDASWNQDIAMRFCAESPSFVAAKGRGTAQLGTKVSRRDTGSKVIGVADGYEIVQLPGETVPLVEIDVDRWKTWLHARLQTPVGKPGGLTMFAATAIEHLGFAKHLTAEAKQEEFVAGKGLVTRWVAKHRNNHWLDATMLACVAGHAAGERLVDEPAPVVTMTPTAPPQAGQPGWTANRPSNWMNR
jgi:phage terminase large subunit GpA-like protein